jgi:ABC-2 type transport system ATP-binding protein
LKLISPPSQAEAILRDQPGVGEIFEENGRLEVEFVGEDEATAGLLAALVAGGVRLVSFTEVSSDLEEVFLRLTKGEVA